jgi:hypothetical protein
MREQREGELEQLNEDAELQTLVKAASKSEPPSERGRGTARPTCTPRCLPGYRFRSARQVAPAFALATERSRDRPSTARSLGHGRPLLGLQARRRARRREARLRAATAPGVLACPCRGALRAGQRADAVDVARAGTAASCPASARRSNRLGSRAPPCPRQRQPLSGGRPAPAPCRTPVTVLPASPAAEAAT